MLLRLLSKFLASLLVSVLCSAIITTILNQTVLSSHYIEGQLAATNSYSKLSTALTNQIAKSSGSNASPADVAKLQSILTPQVLQTKINSALDQLQAYYKGNGPVPVIDLTDLASQAQAAGIPIGSGSGIDKPITLNGNKQVKGISKTFADVRLGTLLGALVLTLLLLAVSWERHRYAVLPDVLINVGLLMGIIAAGFSFAPGIAEKHLKIDFSSNAFAAMGRDLANAITQDLGKRFFIIAATSFVIGLAWRIWIAKQKPKPSNPVKPAKTASPRPAVPKPTR